MSEIDVRPMLADQAGRVASLHAEGIPQGFLSSLPEGVRRSLYCGISNAPGSGVWVAVDAAGEVVGFISGTTRLGRCYRHVLVRRGLVMAWHLVPALFRPAVWRQILETTTYPLRGKRKGSGGPPGVVAPERVHGELLSIVVDASARGTGAAHRLLSTFEGYLLENGYSGPYRVVTMKADARSNRFYAKAGFRRVGSFTHHGVEMALHHKEPTA